MTDTAPPIEADVVEPTDTPQPETPTVGAELATYQAPVALPEAPGGIPAQADLLALAQLANTFAGAELVPKPLQGKPADVLLVLLTARDLGLPATVALRECHPIDGRVTVSPKLKLAIVRERKLGRVWPDPENDVHAHTWYASRHDDPDTTYRSTYTWEDAQRAGLVGRACAPTEHKTTNGKCPCKSNWRMYPGQMLQWRAMGYLMDQAFGEVGTGLYGADELGAITDEEGHIIDVAEVGNLPGMEVPEVPPAPPVQHTPADPDQVWLLQLRIRALPDEQRKLLAAKWKESGRLTYEYDGKRLPYTPAQLPERALNSAESLVKGCEVLATKQGWDQAAAYAEVHATLATWPGWWSVLVTGCQPPTTPPTAPPPEPSDAEAPDVPADPPDASTGHTAGDPLPGRGGPAEPLPPDTDHQPADPEPVVDVVEAIIDHVGALQGKALDAELEANGLATTGNLDTRRKRLGQHLLATGWVPQQAPLL